LTSVDERGAERPPTRLTSIPERNHGMSRTQNDALVSAQPIGRIIRRKQLAEIANHSTVWVDRQARQKNPVLVAVRNANGRVMGFTEASVRRLLGCEAEQNGNGGAR